MVNTRVALFGLGIMGTGMAHRLIGAGVKLSVYNRNRVRAADLMKLGAHVAGSPREAAEHGANAIISMVADDAASRAVWLGETGGLAGAPGGATLIECSTLSVDWVKELSAAAHARSFEFLDCPVTGSKTQAAKGELSFLAGGSAAALDKVRPILSIMGKEINHLGPAGSGAMMKLINNFVCGAQAAALAEAIAMIERTELDPAKALAVLTNGAPGSPLVKAISARMTARDYTPNFHLKLMAKDLTYAHHEAAARALDLTTAATALALLQKAVAAGDGDKDFSVIVEQLRQR